MKIAILGAGAWGTALASHASARHDTVLWSRDPSVLASVAADRVNRAYLPGIALNPALGTEPSLDAAIDGAALIVVATSLAGLRPVLERLRDTGRRIDAVSWLCKGLDADTGRLAHQVVADAMPQATAGCLTGPSFAQEVARGLPVALTAAATGASLADTLVAAFHHGPMRVYRSTDLVGVEIGGALKNVMAIATGIGDGMGLGLNARAALITRGLAEIARFGLAHGASPETFMGLAGMGDLVLTCTGDLSRNRTVGLELAAGRPLDAVLARLGHVAEGVACCRAVVARAASLGVEMPISETVLDVIEGRLVPADALRMLLAREPKAEHR
ncbi:MAG: NAD(P)H-dependent glycerol-3-phosphate dehydrogenase [Lautropia sp.]